MCRACKYVYKEFGIIKCDLQPFREETVAQQQVAHWLRNVCICEDCDAAWITPGCPGYEESD